MKIAIIGDRGIPARYSGFSTLVEELATRLMRDHHIDVTVYCRRSYYEQRPPEFRGVRCVYLPAPGGKSFESLIHSGLSIVHAAARSFDLVFIVDPGNSPLCLPLKIRGTPVVFHTDGLGWQRRKWNRLQRLYYKWSERVAARLGTWLVTDARAMQEYYRAQYGAESSFIPYGSRTGGIPDNRCLEKFGLQKQGYLLVVARMEPENNTDLVIREYRAAQIRMPLVVVGGARYANNYCRAILAESDEKVRCLGSVFESEILNGLYQNCYLYIHAHEVGGTNPSLLRAMGAGAPCLPLDVVFHKEAMGEDAEYFAKTPGSLAAKLRQFDAEPRRVEALGHLAVARAQRLYRWDAVAEAYASLFRDLAKPSAASTAPAEVYQPSKWEEEPELSMEPGDE